MRRLIIPTLVAGLVMVPVSSAGTSPLNFDPSVLAVGHVPVGTTSEEAVTLTNSGSEALTVYGYEAFGENGNFMVNPGSCTLGTILAPGQSCTFTVLTRPVEVGVIRGQFCYTGVGETTSDRECARIIGGAS